MATQRWENDHGDIFEYTMPLKPASEVTIRKRDGSVLTVRFCSITSFVVDEYLERPRQERSG